MSQSKLLLPGEPGFNEVLATPPPDPRKGVCYVHRPGAVTSEAIALDELDEYLLSGEYDERLEEIELEETEIPINEGLRSSVLYLPQSVVL